MAIELGVNIDHVATLREARQTRYPNPIAAAALVEKAGADQITIHLREDRRHIQHEDLKQLRKTVSTKLNLEMAATKEMVVIACGVRPDLVTLVPEKREEVTTEGGLNVVALEGVLKPVIEQLKMAGIVVSLFVEPDNRYVDAAIRLGTDRLEFHTGRYCELHDKKESEKELARLKEAARYAKEMGLFVAAGHGLNYDNIEDVLRNIPEFQEYNIGHSIVSRAVFVGLEEAVREMKAIIKGVGR